ncbi:alpha-lytic protease prodomain-containing protein [Streptomyces sp. MBT65]|uniref:alpha-lytic protease prodomain-containing protein n=1 Tax=Streptomyces sp. MBT65 TaxID=1488395 RepID=UPI00190C60A9|nr:alpha-lytic protease prodomain-containing protein [Streptomyces sp. MBT65]MBK3577695.1 alpha-lytic protease prodomain-containing protein [Streptomyces sp. MBT65]
MRSPTKLCLGLSALLVLGTGALGLTPAAASPSQPTSPQALSPGLTTALQRDLGLTASQARTRLAREAAATKLAPRAERAAGQTFGGSWYDTAHGTLVVGLTDTGGAAADSVRSTGATVVRVTHSAHTLDATKTALDNVARTDGAPSAVRSWHVDPRTSTVVAEVSKGAEHSAAVTKFLAPARKSGLLTVNSVTTAQKPQTFAAGTVGGDPYYINGNTRCSIGFSVVGGFVSAGHCGTPGSSVVGWDGSAMGTFAGSSFPGNDYSYIRIGNGWWTVPVVLGWGTVSDVLVRGSAVAPVGSSVCRSGSTTHWHCGTVLTQNETVNYSQGSVYQLTGTSVCAEPGDSGGSFITGDQAQGVTSGGWGNCTSGGQTWFQPVNEILSTYGLTLVTA